MKRLGYDAFEGGVLGWGVTPRPSAPREEPKRASACWRAVKAVVVWLAARELQQQHSVVFGRSALEAEEGGCCARSATNLQNQG